jgi:hypothetical protein
MATPSKRLRFEHQLRVKTTRKDPYRSSDKPAGRPECPSCGSVNVRGRWERVAKRGTAGRELLCPACRQGEERYAGAVVVLEGARRDLAEVLATLKNAERIARSRNDQERLLWIDRGRGAVRVYVTLPELARRMGRILSSSFKGQVEYRRSSEEPFIHVIWRSDAPAERPRRLAPKTRSGRPRARSFRRRSAAG